MLTLALGQWEKSFEEVMGETLLHLAWSENAIVTSGKRRSDVVGIPGAEGKHVIYCLVEREQLYWAVVLFHALSTLPSTDPEPTASLTTMSKNPDKAGRGSPGTGNPGPNGKACGHHAWACTGEAHFAQASLPSS